MILDALLQFDNAASLAIAAGTQASTNVIDLGITSGIPTSANGGGARDIGIGDDPAMKLLVQVFYDLYFRRCWHPCRCPSRRNRQWLWCPSRLLHLVVIASLCPRHPRCRGSTL